MKARQLLLLSGFLSLSIIGVNAEIPPAFTNMWEYFNKEVGGITIMSSGKEYKFDVCATNALSLISEHGYTFTEYNNIGMCNMYYNPVQYFGYAKGNQVYECTCFTLDEEFDKGWTGAMLLLNVKINMGGIRWKQYPKGPGNVCLLPIGADIKKPQSIKDAFFYRGNVGIYVRNESNRNVLAFIKLLDDCLLASSGEDVEFCTDDNTSTDAPALPNRRWQYAIIGGVFSLCVCAVVYFVRRKKIA